MSSLPSHNSAARLSLYLQTIPGRVLHRLSDTVGYGNLKGPLDLIIVQCLTFLLMSILGYVVLVMSGAPFDEATKRSACLVLPGIAAPFPGLVLNNIHRLKFAMDRLLLTGDILSAHPKLSVLQAYRIAGYLMGRVKETVGYNWRPAYQYMKREYPILLAEIVKRVRVTDLPAVLEHVR